MSVSMLMTGLNGALGLYSSVKGLFDSADAASRQKKLHKIAKAEEDGRRMILVFWPHLKTNRITSRVVLGCSCL